MTHTIETTIEVGASLATLRAAIGTPEGFRGWLAADTEVDAAGRYTFSFGPRAVTFAPNPAADRDVRMTCVHERENPDWLGTELAITLTPLDADRTRVELTHAGYREKNDTFHRSVTGWTYFLSSLAAYATTGKGAPFGAKVAA
ncbi:MAG TPA: SRPBCC domain-containing protein [Polyangiaceae bacterium]|nr:SRPBCC domain-containing protein [Polyangiaceae bacterium]